MNTSSQKLNGHSFKTILATKRILKGVPRRVIAELLGTTEQNIYKFESQNETNLPSMEQARKIGDMLGDKRKIERSCALSRIVRSYPEELKVAARHIRRMPQREFSELVRGL